MQNAAGKKNRSPGKVSAEPGFLLIDASFAPLACNLAGAALLTHPQPPNLARLDRLPIPHQIIDQLRHHCWTRAGSLIIPFQVGSREHLCQAFPLLFGRSEAAPVFVLLLHPSSVAEETVARLAAQFHLTEREREVVHGMAAGLNSRQLATRLGISPNTVKVYLHLVMVKMGVTSRAGMLAKILEQSTGIDRPLRAADAVRKMKPGD